ncbi:mechanosensitive ion channel family protein [Anabaenopsis tanganyikae CS-531]|uniref:Mechanosensitive ion channel family protein n=2 Tax=Anabaenopsis TaxID=110103 RepID=A0ABT5AMP5_9CYAN|nr:MULTISPECIES: mechanosensitive ion channel family protein [Anabaenopsis]MDB9538157.1 mechanosensitive ion channel family protein [Anabaenopsis arnoldii]MDH6092468.1 mechanosensitive ion channel family protein [Anabaenopsis arnoldii]MDH6104939.1 mechanosensitive ion channel family protein [Anabaenopsis tanganyikae CS-531]
MMVSLFPKGNSRSGSRQFLVVIFFLGVILPTQRGLTQEISPTPVISQPSQPEQTPTTGLFFADIVVRGKPVFQVGSLGELSATQRAEIINRRIASILVRSQTDTQVSLVPDPQRGIATLQLNNRVVMTVTRQDAEDFNLDVETLGQWWVKQLNQAFEQPPLVIDVGQRLFSTLRKFQQETIDNLPSFLGMLLVVITTGLIAASMRHVTLTGAQHWEVDRNSKILVSRLVYGLVWVIGAIVALGVLGLDFATLLGTLGLTSVAIGFSLKDILSNYFSGVVLLVSRPFRLGDQIVIRDFEGTVTQIQLRATTVKTYDGRVVYIPNQEVFSAIIINNTASNIRRNSITFGIDYKADITKAKQVINDAVLSVPEIEKEPKPDILVRQLAPSTVNIEVRCWVNSRRLPFLEATSLMAQAIKEALEEAEINMPTDIYTLKFNDILTISQQKP